MGQRTLDLLRSGCIFIRMDRRTAAATETITVSSALTNSGVDLANLSQATDIHLTTLRARLDDPSTFTLAEMVRVGGFLRLHPAELLGDLA